MWGGFAQPTRRVREINNMNAVSGQIKPYAISPHLPDALSIDMGVSLRHRTVQLTCGGTVVTGTYGVHPSQGLR